MLRTVKLKLSDSRKFAVNVNAMLSVNYIVVYSRSCLSNLNVTINLVVELLCLFEFLNIKSFIPSSLNLEKASLDSCSVFPNQSLTKLPYLESWKSSAVTEAVY